MVNATVQGSRAKKFVSSIIRRIYGNICGSIGKFLHDVLSYGGGCVNRKEDLMVVGEGVETRPHIDLFDIKR